MIPTSASTTAPTTATTTTAAGQMGARAPQRQRLSHPLMIAGGQDATAWLWRCVEQADHAGYDASAAEFYGHSVRAPHADLWRVRSRQVYGVIHRVSYTPHQRASATSHTSMSHAHDGLWRCSCDAGMVGAACAHIGAAYLAACHWDMAQEQRRRTFAARMAQLQEQARYEEEAARYYTGRYRALAAQMAQLQAEAAHALSHEPPPAAADASMSDLTAAVMTRTVVNL